MPSAKTSPSPSTRPARRPRESVAQAGPEADGLRPGDAGIKAMENETSERVANAVVTIVPFLLLFVAGWLAWGGLLHWQDLVIMAITYLLTGLAWGWLVRALPTRHGGS